VVRTFRRIAMPSFSATEKHCDSSKRRGSTHATTQFHTKHTTRCATLCTPCTSTPFNSTHTRRVVMKRPRIPAPKRRPQHETDSSHIRELSAFCVTFCTSTVCAEKIGTFDVTYCNLLSVQKTSVRLTTRSVYLLSVQKTSAKRLTSRSVHLPSVQKTFRTRFHSERQPYMRTRHPHPR
jgi:hypothetical protein